MRPTHTLKTTILVSPSAASETEVGIAVLYSVTPGYPETRDEPGCDATAEISAIQVGGVDQPWLAQAIGEDETLLADCLADWVEWCREEQSAAAEYRADQRRDDLMMERF